MKYSNTFVVGLAICFFALPGIQVRAEVTDCAEIEDAVERLACYDEQFRRDEPREEPQPEAAPAGEIETTPIAEPAPVKELPPPAEVSPAADVAESPVPTPPPPASDRTFLGDVKVNLTSTIKTVRTGEKQKMVFLLENDEIWMQATPRPLPFDEGDTVTIKNALFGGYFMRSERGTSTRVQRIH